MVKSEMANITGIPYSPTPEPHNLSLSLSLSLTHTHTHQISKIGCNMFGDESYFDNFLAHHSAGSGSASISISVQQSAVGSAVAFSNTIDWAALSSIQTISSNGDPEINSEMVKSDQVQPAISIPGDGETDKCRSSTVSVKRDPTKTMVLSSIPAYLDPANWQQQPSHQTGNNNNINHINHHEQLHQQQLHQQQLHQQQLHLLHKLHQQQQLQPQQPAALLQPPPQPGSIRPGSMAERTRMANIPMPEPALKCPRCESSNTKFCYFNNYSLNQPRHFCKTCRRYWTRGSALRSVPVGGGCHRNKRTKSGGVSLSTSKRRCRELGLERWPNSKRKNGHCLPSSARVLKKSKGQCSNGGVIENEDAATKSVPLNEIARDKSTAMGNDELDRENDIIAVLATYEDDTVPFPLPCNSGIEELHKELDDSFQIEGVKYKIKYKQEDGQWITLLTDKHLRFHIENLKASGQSTMQLSVFPNSL